MFSAFSGVSSIASHTLPNRFLAGFLAGLPEAMQDIDRISKLRDVNDTERPAASRILISCTPAPMLGIGFQSSGWYPCCTRSI
jgi:hypothetical protein